MSNDNRGQVTREKQVTSDSQLEAQASPTRLTSHTVSNTFSKNVSFFQWWEVAVLFSGITTALIERQELRCMRVWPTEREMSVVLHVLLFSRFSSRDTWAFHPSQ